MNTGKKSQSIALASAALILLLILVSSTATAQSASPTGTYAYIPNALDGTVSVIDTTMNTVTSIVTNVGNSPYGVAVTPDGTKVYVTNWASNTVSVINTATNQITNTVTVGGCPVAFGQFIGPALAKATPTITWSNPADIIYGTPLSSTQLDAVASVLGTFTYTPAAGTVLSAGTQTLQAVFTPTDSTNYATETTSVQINVLTPVQKIQQMTNSIQGLVTSGQLKQGQAAVLKVTLDTVKVSLNNGKTKVATVELNAFIAEVKAYVKNGILSSQNGQMLIDGANAVINAIK